MSKLTSDFQLHGMNRRNTMIALEIVNNSPETKNLKFLGMEYEKVPEGVTVRNIYGETMYDDGNLLQLREFIMACGAIGFSGMRFSSSDYSFVGKVFSIEQRNHFGEIKRKDLQLMNFVQAMNFNPSIIEVQKGFILDAYTSIEQTNVLAGETMVMMFFPETKTQERLSSMIDNMEKTFSKDKKRKIMFIS